MLKLPEITDIKAFVIDQLRLSLRPADLVHGLETLCIAAVAFLLLTLALFGFRVDSWMHELANFLNHYLAATPQARFPVECVLVGVFIVILGFVLIARGRFAKAEAHG